MISNKPKLWFAVENNPILTSQEMDPSSVLCPWKFSPSSDDKSNGNRPWGQERLGLLT